MSRRIVAISLAVALVGVGLALPAQAAKKKRKPKKPAVVQVEQQMFLRGEACTADARALSLTDNADSECIYTRSGLIYDTIPETAPAPVGSNPWHTWPATDGVPFKLDTTKPVGGEIFVKGAFPLVGDYPGISAGNVKLTIKLVGEAGGEEVVIGEFVDEYTVKPGDGAHASAVEIQPDAALEGVEFSSLTLHTRIGGPSVGHAVYQLNNPSSYITVPTWASATGAV